MKYTLYFLNTGRRYSVMPSVKIVDKLSTELNMYELTLSTLDEELDLDYKNTNGLTEMQLLMDNKEEIEVIDMYMTYYHKTIVGYNPLRYKYVIQATSPTFKLQRIVLPNKLITQPIDGEKKTIYREVEKIMEVYAPEITIDPKLKNVPEMQKACPELQFTKSTLHEVLIGLFAVAKLGPIMKEFNKLSFFRLDGNREKNWQSRYIFIRQETSNAAANYSDMLDMDIENAISKDEDITTTWIPATTEESGLTTENYSWKLPSDIYEIKSVDLIGEGITFTLIDQAGIPSTKQTWDVPISITKYVVSKAIYDTLKVSSALTQKGIDYKRNNLYYEGDTITGGAYNEDTWFGGGLIPALTNVITEFLEEVYVGVQKQVTDVEIEDPRRIMLRAIYKSESDNTRVKIIKKGVKAPINALINNQDDAYIDSVNFGNTKQEQINRLGNEETTGQANVRINIDTYKKTPQIGDRVDDKYIISERESLLKENTMISNYKLSKDYVFTTGYAGLNQLKRFTQIDKNGTLIRNDNFLYNFQLSYVSAIKKNYLINRVIDHYGEESLGMCLHYFEARLDDATSQSHMLLLTSQNKHIADSIVCQMGFIDNYTAGTQIHYEGKKMLTRAVKYTNDNGEFKKARIYFGAGEEQRNEKNYDIVSNYPEARFEITTNVPYLDYLIYKDTREISNFTFQFRIIGNQDIFIYDYFYKYTELTKHPSEKLKVYVLFSYNELTEKYTQETTQPLGTYYQNSSILFGKNKAGETEQSITIRQVLDEFGSYAIGVTNSQDQLLFACNYTHYQGSTYDLKLFMNEI